LSKARDNFRKEVLEHNRAKNNGELVCAHKEKGNCKGKLIADHIDNNSDNNDSDNNGQVLCMSHNKKKNNSPSRIITYLRKKELSLPIYTYTRKKRETLIVGSVGMQKNVTGYPAVFDWLRDKLKSTPAIEYNDKLINSASKIGKVRQSTVRGWFETETSDEGEFALRDVTIKGEKVECIMTKQDALDFDFDSQRSERK